MSFKGRLDSIYDLQSIDKEHEHVAAQIDNTVKQVVNAHGAIQNATKGKTLSFAGLADSANQVNKALVDIHGNVISLKSIPAAVTPATTAITGMGKAARATVSQIGDVTKANNRLTFSVTQIVRELPAASYGFNVFMGAISNNLAMVGDEIKRTKELNKQLRLEGKQGISVFNAIAGAVFSWQTALAVAFMVLIKYADKLPELIRGTKELSNAHDELSNVLKGTSSTYAETGAEIEGLNKRFHDATTTVEEKNRIVKQLDKSYGDIVGGIKTLADAEKFFIDQAPAYVEAMKQRGLADAAYTLIGRNAVKRLEEKNKTVADIPLVDRYFEGIKTVFKNFFIVGRKGINEAYSKLAETNKKNALDFLASSDVELAKIAEQAEEAFNGILDAFNFDFDKEDNDRFADFTNAELAAIKRVIAAQAERRKLEYEKEKEANAQILADEKIYYEERLKALSDLYINKSKILEIDQDKELEQIQSKLQKIEQIESKAVDQRTQQEKNLLIEKRALLEEQETIITKFAIKQAGLDTDYYIGRLQIIKQGTNEEVKYRIDALGKIARHTEQGYADELTALTSSLKDGTLNYQQYQQAKSDLENKYTSEIISTQIEYLADELTRYAGSIEGREELEKRLHNLKINLADADAKHFEDTEKRKQWAQQQTIDNIKATFNELADVAQNMYAADIQKQDDKINGIDKETEARKQQIQNELISSEEKERRIAELELSAQIRRQQAEQQKAELQRRAAQFEKAVSITSIIAKTAEAIMSALKIPIYGEALAISYGILGAAQIAKVASAPIPAYKHGVRGHGGGLAIVGDGYESEKVILKGGQTFFTPAEPTLIDLPKGADVIPMHKLPAQERQAAAAGAAIPLNLQEHTDKTVKAINNVTRAVNGKRAPRPIGYDWKNYLTGKL